MKRPIHQTLTILLAALPIAACAHDDAPASDGIADYDPQTDENLIRNARYKIIIHSGPGIPGTPGAGEYYREPKRVLQAIVDTCDLGPTIYTVATDGVSVLTIVDDSLSEAKVACIRSAEAPGLSLSDTGPAR